MMTESPKWSMRGILDRAGSTAEVVPFPVRVDFNKLFDDIRAWQQKNRYALQDFWARDKDGALAVKAEIEKVVNAMQKEAAE